MRRVLTGAALALALPLAAEGATLRFETSGATGGRTTLSLTRLLPLFDPAQGVLTGAQLRLAAAASSEGVPDRDRAFDDDAGDTFGTCAVDAVLMLDVTFGPFLAGGSDFAFSGSDCNATLLVAEAFVSDMMGADASDSFFADLTGTGSFAIDAEASFEPTNVRDFATGLSLFAEIVYTFEPVAVAAVPLPGGLGLLAAGLGALGLVRRRAA